MGVKTRERKDKTSVWAVILKVALVKVKGPYAKEAQEEDVMKLMSKSPNRRPVGYREN
jgi:hypothetical protein